MRIRLAPARRAIQCAAFIAGSALWVGCASVEHAFSANESAGSTLATGTPTGSARLDLEVRADSAVREVLKTHGTPAFLHVVDRDQLYLFYPEADRVVVVTRNGLPPGAVFRMDRIPGHFFRLLPGPVVARIQAARAATRQGTASLRRHPPAAVAPPESSARDSSVRLANFDADKMIERLREPLSAADPGVSGWRAVSLADGSRAVVASAAGAEFRVRPESVTAAAGIRPESRTTPAAVRTGYTRVNRAVFGTRAPAVSLQVAGLVDAVAADPSGRTRRVSRIAGRSVSVVRDARQGLLVYSVAAE